MWLPSEEPKDIIYGNKFDETRIPSLGYIKVFNEDYEFILFINQNLIVGAWYLDTNSLSELYENDAMGVVKVLPESKIEMFELNLSLFETVIELNDECKLSLPFKIGMLWDKIGMNCDDSRETLLSRYRIKDPSEEDIDSLISGYKS